MAEFFVSVPNHDMATQVAAMVNKYNRWITRFSAQSILLTSAKYFVELDGSKVVGCASHLQDHETLTKIQHICVLPAYRQHGIAKKLTKLAISYCDTEYVYMTIREDNYKSLLLAHSLEFRYVEKNWFRDHWTLTFGRRKENAGRDHMCN